MVRKTRRSNKTKGIYSIPELRRSFEHIEKYVDDKINTKESKEHIIKDLKKEWKNVFFKELNKKSAESFVNSRMKCRRKTRKNEEMRGGFVAPVDYVTRPGIYLEPGQTPVDGGHYGNYVDYVNSGFRNPEIAQQYDPVLGQTRFPTHTGGRHKGRRLRKSLRKSLQKGGGIVSILTEIGNRPYPATVPSHPLHDIISISKGQSYSFNPSHTAIPPYYQFNNMYPSAVTY